MIAAVLAAALAFLPAGSAHQGGTRPPGDALVNEWCVQRDLVLVDAAQRHYDIALWCWKVGLRQQATSAILYSLFVSDGRFRPAKSTLAKMRQLEGAEWEEVPRPNPTLLRDHAKRVAKAKELDLRDHLRLAQWAAGKGLDEEARAVYERLLEREGAPLELDAQGCLRIGKTAVRADYSRAIFDSGVDLNGKRYLRDAFLRALPDVGALFEAVSGELRIRSTISAENAAHLHALGLALLPRLERELGGRPTERLEVYVLTRRADYDRYLESAGLTRFAYGTGVADRKTRTAVVCQGEGELDALVLHELTHLFQYGLTRAVMPDWYSEGLAETFGGPGTFRRSASTLEFGQLLGPERRALLATGQLLPLQQLLDAEAHSLFPQQGWLFYAQSWAFLRFLREDPQAAERFRQWERTCTGAALGADEGDLRASDAKDARALFQAVFGGELSALEARFHAFLAGMK